MCQNLISHLKTLSNEHEGMHYIEGVSRYMFGFGDRLGEVEFDSKDFKLIKGDYYVMCSGLNGLNMLGAAKYYAAIRSFRTAANDGLSACLLNGPMRYQAPDYLPVVGLG